LNSLEEGDNITVTDDLLKAMEEAIDVVKQQDKEYIALDLETRELRTESDKMVAEHLAFAELAKKADEQQKAEIERLTEERDIAGKKNFSLIMDKSALQAKNAELQKQVDEYMQFRKEVFSLSTYKLGVMDGANRFAVELNKADCSIPIKDDFIIVQRKVIHAILKEITEDGNGN